MATKKMTAKQKREAQQKAALRQRVSDIATGAAGYRFDDGEAFATADFLSRFVPALEVQFGADGNSYLWSTHSLLNYDDVDLTTDYLWDHGVRA